MSLSKVAAVQLVYGTDIRSTKLGNEIVKEAKNSSIEVEKYDFKYFPHIPIRKVSLPFPFLPLIALLSRKLLDYIWSTPNKEAFIAHITGYSENILHIWVGELDEKQVRVYSTYLLSKNQTFHIIREKELINYGEKWFNKVYELLSDARKDIIPRPFCVQAHHGRYLEDGRNCISLPDKGPEMVITSGKRYGSMPEYTAKLNKDKLSSTDSGISIGPSRSSDVPMDSAMDGFRRLQSVVHRPDGGTIPRSGAARDGPRGGGAREMAKAAVLGSSTAETDGNEGPSGGTRQPPKKKKPKRNPKKKK